MTGHSVSMSNSVELAPGMSATWRANSHTAICMPRQTPRYGILLLAGDARGADLALDAAAAEAAGDEDAVGVRQAAQRLLVGVERLGVDPVDLDLALVLRSREWFSASEQDL